MKRPVIGIEADVDVSPLGRRFARVNEAYYQAVFEAGGNPVLLPPLEGDAAIERALDVADAIVLPGGDDLPAEDYGEEPLACTASSAVDGTRYRYSRALVRAAWSRDLPLLGVCYGHQVLNVALGGALVQDIPIQLPGSLTHRVERLDTDHEVEIVAGSRLARITETPRGTVNSRHHQSVRRPGEGLTVVARSPDGVVEAVEGTGTFVIGVQWHPERMGPGKLGWGLFEALVAAARA